MEPSAPVSGDASPPEDEHTLHWCSEGRLAVDGKLLEYACHGPGPAEAPVLVLLHEGLGCIRLWRDFPAALAAATGHGVFVYSRSGYGQSDPVELPRPLDYMTREANDVLPQVLDAIAPRQAVLLGHSDGATIAAIHAGTVADERVRGVVLLAPHFFTEAAGLAEIARVRHTFESDDELRQKMSRYHRDPVNAFRGWNDSWLDPGFRDWNVADVIDRISVPVLAIQGRDDPYGSLEQIRIIARQACGPVQTVVLDGVRHTPHLERGAEVIAAVAQFVDPGQLWPGHAYVPGRNARHAEDAFDRFKRSVRPGATIDELAACEAYGTALRWLEAGYGWEAHELLEPVWLALPDDSVERRFVQSLIQLANGRLKGRMGRPAAARRLAALARELLPPDGRAMVMGTPLGKVRSDIDELEAAHSPI